MGVGSIPVGFGPVGGEGSPDYEYPLVENMSPYNGDVDVMARPTVTFDVVDYTGNLDANTIKVWIDGVLVYDAGIGFLDPDFPGVVSVI